MALADKTEAATPRRREDARKKGTVARSQELGPAAVMLVGLLCLQTFGGRLLETVRVVTRVCITMAAGSPEPEKMPELLLQCLGQVARAAVPLLGCLALTALVVGATQTKMLMTLKPLNPDWSRVNPLKGFTRVFSIRAILDLVKSVLKVSLLAALCFSFGRSITAVILSLSGYDLTLGLSKGGQLVSELLWRSAAILAVLAVIDYIVQRWQYERNLRMSKQEIKEEMRQMEGDPIIRGFLRRKQREAGRRRMMDAVPSAAAVVTNPTHIAIALSYDRGKSVAPVVVAKGARLMAERIREVAREHGVPVVEDPPLARTLYKTVDVGEMIPPEMYRAVAEILAFVYRLKPNKPSSVAGTPATGVTGG
jgi:flagellar biosynthesis protein FlhB